MGLHFTTSHANCIDQVRSQVELAAELVTLQQARVAALGAKGFPTGKAEALLSDTIHTLSLFRSQLEQLEAQRMRDGSHLVETAPPSRLARAE